MLTTRSLLFNTLFYLNLMVLMVVGLPTMLFGRRAIFALARLWGAISVWLLETICGLRLEYRGIENIPPGALLIAAKHQSFLETFALLKYAPDFAIILKRQLTYVPLFGLYLIVSQQIAIDRGRGRQALNQIAAGSVTQWTVAGAALLTLLFVGSTRFTESISLSRYPEYADYQDTTSVVVPWFPKGTADEATKPA